MLSATAPAGTEAVGEEDGRFPATRSNAFLSFAAHLGPPPAGSLLSTVWLNPPGVPELRAPRAESAGPSGPPAGGRTPTTVPAPVTLLPSLTAAESNNRESQSRCEEEMEVKVDAPTDSSTLVFYCTDATKAREPCGTPHFTFESARCWMQVLAA